MLQNNLARLYDELGWHEAAIDLHEATLDERLASLGPDHAQTLISMNNLGGAYQKAGRLEEADLLLSRSLRVHERVLGPEHHNTLTVMSNLATLCAQRGDLAEAERLTRTALERRRAAFGDAHLGTLDAWSNLGWILLQRDRVEEAAELLAEQVAVAEASHPADDWRVAVYRGNLGAALNLLGLDEEAESHLLRAHAVLDRTFGAEHLHTRALCDNLVDLYERRDEPEHAARFRY